MTPASTTTPANAPSTTDPAPQTRPPTPVARRDRRTVPTQLAAMVAGVTEATIRKWASRGKLTRYGRPGRAEYDLDELYELVVESRSRNTV
jgi:hypothetical protein